MMTFVSAVLDENGFCRKCGHPGDYHFEGRNSRGAMTAVCINFQQGHPETLCGCEIIKEKDAVAA